MDQLLFKQHPSPMLIYDLETLRILKVNNAFFEKYKYSQEEIIRKDITIKEIRPKDDIPKLVQSLENLSSGINDSGIHRHRSKDGTIFYVKISSQNFQHEGTDSRLVVLNDITEQVEAEKRSAKSLEVLQHHIANSPLAAIKWDHDFNILEWSGQAERITGYKKEEVLNENLFSFGFFSHVEADLIHEKIELLVKGEQKLRQFETIITRKDGGRTYIRIHPSAVRGINGRLESVLTLIEDVNEQKKSEIKYQRLFENANDSILIMRNRHIVDCNRQAEAVFKASREHIIGKTLDYFSPPKQPDGSCSVKEVYKRIDQALEKGANIFEWQHKNTEGQLIDVEVSLNKVEFPGGEYVQAIVRDITDKKSTQVKLRKNEEMFRNLFLKSPAALVMVDEQDKVQVVNESFERMFGHDLGDILGKDIDKLIVPPQELENAPQMKKSLSEGRDFQIEGIRLSKSGEEKHVIIAGMPIKIDGEPVAGLGMYMDITDRKISEKRLKKSLEEKQVLLEEIHHRVKNNLAVISGLLELEAMDWAAESAVQKVMKQSKLRIQSMAMIHEKLYQSRSFSHLKFGNYISELMDTIYNTMGGKQKNVTVDVESDNIVLNINQAISCAMILNELATNSFKYAYEDNGEGKLTIKLKNKGDTISIVVEDNGPGLPDNFDGMVTTSLGHQLVNQLVKQLKGEIAVESSEDAGTCYEITFEKNNVSGSSSTNRIKNTDSVVI